MSKYLIVNASKEDAPTRGDVRAAAAQAYPKYSVEAILDLDDSWDVRLARKDHVSRIRRTAEFPPGLVDKEDKPKDPPSDEAPDEDNEEEPEEEESEEDKKEEPKPSKDKKSDDPLEQLEDLVNQIEGLVDQLRGTKEKVRDKADKVDEVRDLVSDEPGPEEIGPVPGGPPTGGPPAPKVPGRPGPSPAQRKPPVGVPTFSKRQTRIVRRDANVSAAFAAAELEQDPQFEDYEVEEIKRDTRTNQFVAKLKLREE